MLGKLKELYGREAKGLLKEIDGLIYQFNGGKSSKKTRNKKSVECLTEADSILITYGDSIQHKGEAPLRTLGVFLEKHVKDAISAVHLLPFYPYSSDDGFSVIDYMKVKEELGDWTDVAALSDHYELMFDAVINHISSQSRWYEGYKNGESPYRDYFITCDPEEDYTKVVRPRALPLLSPVEVKGETQYVWTTFSDDQIDLNYRNPQIFLEILKVLLVYIEKGAKYIRLDAIGFAWKELGTTCIHLKETHMLIQLMREALLQVKEDLIIITETNVPHKENISYFGDGYNEAHMVYQFPLPPLTLYSLLSGDAKPFMQWAKGLSLESDNTTYFNFLASHDGIGLRPVENILNDEQIKMLTDTVEGNQGRISFKNNSDGSKSPYEMNVNYMDALQMKGDTLAMFHGRFIAAQSILYAMAGVPGIYIHSLLGSGNDVQGVEASGINRRINREKLDYTQLTDQLEHSERRKTIFEANLHMLNVRKQEPAFSPYGKTQVLKLNDSVISFKRMSMDEKESILVLVNVANTNKTVEYRCVGTELLTKSKIDKNKLVLKPYEVVWIKSA